MPRFEVRVPVTLYEVIEVEASEERLAQECDRYGLPHDLDSLLRHIYGNHALIVGAKDYTIAALDEKLQGRAATSAFEEGVFEGYLKGFEAGYRRGEADAIAANPEAEALAAADEMAEQLQEDGPLIVEGDAVARYLAARGHPGGPWWPR